LIFTGFFCNLVFLTEHESIAMGFEAAYRSVSPAEWDARLEALDTMLERCELCPRACHVNRTRGEKGFCNATAEAMVSSIGPHFGEEPELVGRFGSGTIFLTHCNLGCLYCQNYDISHFGDGRVMTPEEIADGMLHLQQMGCHNINFVTPTHYAPQLIRAVRIASAKGLRVPIVWNCGGYERVEVIRLLEGIVDIYMPDAKYGAREPAETFSSAPDYWERCKESLREMHRQVGVLETDSRGIALRGVLIRHLILPNDMAGSREVLAFIARELSTDSYVNIMFQYRPLYRAQEFREINRRPALKEFAAAIDMARLLGLHRGFSA
jgi:putative pyruvate formate lyase activating enzyme